MVSNTNVIRPNSLVVIPESEAGTLHRTQTLLYPTVFIKKVQLSFSLYSLEAGNVQTEDQIVVV